MPEFATAYPAALPIDDAREIIRIFNGGSILQEKSALAKHIWVLQGYFQGALLGDPDNLRVFSAQATAQWSGVDPIVMLQHLVDQETASRAGLPTAQILSVPLGILLQWAIKQLVVLLAAELGVPIA